MWQYQDFYYILNEGKLGGWEKGSLPAWFTAKPSLHFVIAEIVSDYNSWWINNRWHHQMSLWIPLRQQNQSQHLQKGLACGWPDAHKYLSLSLWAPLAFCPFNKTSSQPEHPYLAPLLKCGVIPSKSFNLSLLKFIIKRRYWRTMAETAK